MPTHEQIEKVAGKIWEQEGYPFGKEKENWYRAEKILELLELLRVRYEKLAHSSQKTHTVSDTINFESPPNSSPYHITINNSFIRRVKRIRASRFVHVGLVFLMILALTAIIMLVSSKISSTKYPEPQIVNLNNETDLYVKLDSFSLPDRMLQIQVNYWTNSDIREKITQYGQNWEIRAWISKPIKETPALDITQSNNTDNSSVSVTITATPYFGTPVSTINQPSVNISGPMTGEPRNFPFDEYAASIGTQNDYNIKSEIQSELPVRIHVENHLKDYELFTKSGGQDTAIITLKRTFLSKSIPFIPLFILLLYVSWITYSIFFMKKPDRTSSLISNVALFLSVLSLRALVVPNGIPFGCTFDWALIIPVIIIFIGIVRIIKTELTLNN